MNKKEEIQMWINYIRDDLESASESLSELERLLDDE